MSICWIVFSRCFMSSWSVLYRGDFPSGFRRGCQIMNHKPHSGCRRRCNNARRHCAVRGYCPTSHAGWGLFLIFWEGKLGDGWSFAGSTRVSREHHQAGRSEMAGSGAGYLSSKWWAAVIPVLDDLRQKRTTDDGRIWCDRNLTDLGQ